jgi:site-specific DNA-methyltransferase (adenine-specific)
VSENGLVPRDIGPGLVRPGMAEDILAVVLTLEQEDDIARLWDGATTFDAAVEKFQGYRDEQHELRRSNAYCEIQLGHLLGPNPGAGPGRGKKGSAQNLLIPKEIRSKLRRFYGYRDDLVALVRTDPTMVYREERLKWVARQEANARTKEARARAATDALPTAVLLLGEADARALPLADDTVDLIVTSPPYGLDIAYDGGDVAAEAWPSFMAAWLAEALRVTKPSGRLALNVPLDTSEPTYRPTYAQAVVAALMAGWEYRSTVVWAEGNTTKGGWALGSQASAARPHHVSQVEMIVLLSKGEWGPSSTNADDITREQFLEAGRGPWTFSGESRPWEGHPAAFPSELPRRLVRYLSRVGDVVLDPFCGSGTALVAALDLKRHVYGFDISAEYVESARRRVATVAKQEDW